MRLDHGTEQAGFLRKIPPTIHELVFEICTLITWRECSCGNEFGCVCLFVCASVCVSLCVSVCVRRIHVLLTFDCVDPESCHIPINLILIWFWFVFEISISYFKVIGSRSRSKKHFLVLLKVKYCSGLLLIQEPKMSSHTQARYTRLAKLYGSELLDYNSLL